MENFKKSDKNWEDYWNKLMLKSKKPIPWGTIVHEKPKHGDLTSTEDASQHKEIKKQRFKKKMFKDDIK